MEPLTDLDPVTEKIGDRGYDVCLTPRSIENIKLAGFRGENLALAIVATDILVQAKPITLRGLMYQVVSAGWLPSTDAKHYRRLGRLMTRLREERIVPFNWLVDGIRLTDKPSSWSGLGEFADAVRDAYRFDFWSRLAEYVHVICEKDAIAGVLQPVTRQYDVCLSPIRGYSSLSFAHGIATAWSQIEKPVTAFYLGDFDASGFDLERDVREKITRYCNREFNWIRLGVNESDFEDFNLRTLAVKDSDCRARGFRRQHGDRCAEIDAIPAVALRQRLQDAIEGHIPAGEWERLQEIEENERTQWQEHMAMIA